MQTDISAASGWRPWAVWMAANLAFAITMFSRTSFGVAGLAAAEQFSAPVGIMSVFVIVQMALYASMQIPAGVLLDRLGSQKTIAIGLAVMMTGQLILAVATSFPVGLGARVLIGGGDALIFVSAIRLIVTWFPARQVPVLTQITAVCGQIGQWASAVPLVWLLGQHGWTPAFLTVAGACLAGVLVDLLVVRDTRPGSPVSVRGNGGGFAGVREVIALPAAQLGFFLHMATAFAPLVFSFMWGFPYLTKAQDLSDAEAGQLFTVMVVAGVVIGPAMGVLTRKFAEKRIFLALVVVGLTVVVWSVALVWPGTAPMPLLVSLVIVLAADFPASNIAFDINRSYIPGHRLGTATGLVIVGGFLAALIDIAVIGAILSLLGGHDPGPNAFRVAMATQLVVWVFATVMVLRKRRQLIATNPLAD